MIISMAEFKINRHLKKAAKHLSNVSECFVRLAQANAEKDFNSGAVFNRYKQGTQQWEAYEMKIKELESKS